MPNSEPGQSGLISSSIQGSGVRFIISSFHHYRIVGIQHKVTSRVYPDFLILSRLVSRYMDRSMTSTSCIFNLGILKRQHLQDLMKTLVANGDAAYEPEKQTESVLLYWKRPEQWAETIHEWVSST